MPGSDHCFQDKHGNLPRKKRRYSIANLDILLRAVAEEQVIVGKGLQTSSFANRKATALDRIGVNEVVAILRDVARDGRGWRSPALNSKAIGKFAAVPVLVVGCETGWEFISLG